MSTSLAAAKPIPADYRETMARCAGQYDAASSLAERALERNVRNVFLVGCGGSLSAMYAAQYLLESRSPALATSVLSSDELNWRRPPTLDAHSLVVVGSHTGTTPETVRAAELASSAGALVGAVTRTADSPLASLADAAFAYESTESAGDAKNVLTAQIAVALLERSRCLQPELPSPRATFEALPDALYTAKEETETLTREIAVRFKDAAVVYVLAAGPTYGVGYALAMCYLQEMQWMHAAAINAGEFFHGAFEVITKETPVLILLDEAETRPMGERALQFAQRYSRKAIAVDSKSLALPGVDEQHRDFVSPLALGAVSSRIAANLAAVRNHPLDTRRYMFRVPY